MNTNRTQLSLSVLNQSGFSLVELMVVVAIIGVLASVAVPNFQKYQARARQTEAKVQLASIFSMEKAFIMDQNSYSTCLKDLGFMPNASGKAYYTIGFKDAALGSQCGPAGDKACNRTIFDGVQADCPTAAGAGSVFFLATAKVGNPATPGAADLDQTSMTNVAFKAQAVGYIFSAANKDSWTIDQDKNLVVVNDGLK